MMAMNQFWRGQPQALDPNAPQAGGGTMSPIQGAGLPSAMAGGPIPGAGADGGGLQMPSGIDPALAAIYQKAGMTPADRGTGFADWQYWQGVGPSQYQRLAADLAGTGTDQPTGTPGAGPWQMSGQTAAMVHGGDPQTSTSADGILQQIEQMIQSQVMQQMQGGGSGQGGQ